MLFRQFACSSHEFVSVPAHSILYWAAIFAINSSVGSSQTTCDQVWPRKNDSFVDLKKFYYCQPEHCSTSRHSPPISRTYLNSTATPRACPISDWSPDVWTNRCTAAAAAGPAVDIANDRLSPVTHRLILQRAYLHHHSFFICVWKLLAATAQHLCFISNAGDRWAAVRWSVASLTLYVCLLCARVTCSKRKTARAIDTKFGRHIYSMAGPRHVLSLSSKGQRTRSRGHQMHCRRGHAGRYDCCLGFLVSS